MAQTRLQSAAETAVNVTIGMGVAWATSMLVYPLFHIPVNAGQAWWITVVFTVISVVRGYACRRVFNWLHR